MNLSSLNCVNVLSAETKRTIRKTIRKREKTINQRERERIKVSKSKRYVKTERFN